ncbi:MAG: sialidase family protein [Thermodesulfobacteriota bacterium]
MTLRVQSVGSITAGPALIAGSAACANGDLLVACNTGGDVSPGQEVHLVRSRDGGRTWQREPVAFASRFVGGGVESGCTLTRLAAGRLLLPYADGYYLSPGQGWDRRAVFSCPFSDDHGHTWQHGGIQPFAGLEAFVYGRVVELAGGDLLLPLWGSFQRQGRWKSGVLRSRDRGLTWGEHRFIVESGVCDETPIIRLPSGRLLALIRGLRARPASLADTVAGRRRRQAFHVALSEDGRIWSRPERTNLAGTAPSLHLSPTGQLLAGFRSTDPSGACRIAMSPDEGRSWQTVLELVPPEGRWRHGGYPVLLNLPDGTMLATFHNNVDGWRVGCNRLVKPG